jgi:hypothetical protein
MIYSVNINRELLWIVVAVAIAVATVMIVARSVGLTSALPQSEGQTLMTFCLHYTDMEPIQKPWPIITKGWV